MATWDDVRQLATGLPEVAERTAGELLEWRVKDKNFVWERPLRRGDLAALGGTAPTGPILGVHVADLGVKDALIAENPAVYFTTPHFNGYRAILVQLDHITADELRELIVEAWLARAPKRVAAAFLAQQPTPPSF